MTSTERLLVRLREMGLDQELPDGTVIRRTYAGRVQRAQGAWSWFAVPESFVPGLTDVGSQVPVTELLRARRLVASMESGSWAVDPYDGAEHPAGGRHSDRLGLLLFEPVR